MNAFNHHVKSHVPAILWAVASLFAPVSSSAEAASLATTASVPENSEPPQEVWAVHGQITNVTQGHPGFRSPYSGQNSLQSDGRVEETTDVTLYAGVRPWKGAEVWLNAEVDQGFGLDNTVGVAGYPSGEAYKIGSNAPYLRLPRGFVRQTVDLGEARDTLASSANQFGGVIPNRRKFPLCNAGTHVRRPFARARSWKPGREAGRRTLVSPANRG